MIAICTVFLTRSLPLRTAAQGIDDLFKSDTYNSIKTSRFTAHTPFMSTSWSRSVWSA